MYTAQHALRISGKKLLISRQKGEGGKSLRKKKKKVLHRVINNGSRNNGGKQEEGKTRWQKNRDQRGEPNEIFACRNVSRVRSLSGDDEHVWRECNNNDTPTTWKITSLWVAYGLVRGMNRCGREAGTIESRGCNMFHGGINARGTLWIRVDRDREAPCPPPYPPPYWQSVKSTVLHTIPLPNPAPSNPPTPLPRLTASSPRHNRKRSKN